MDLEKLVERLQEDGLDVSSTDDEKIKHLWHLYVKTDVIIIMLCDLYFYIVNYKV